MDDESSLVGSRMGAGAYLANSVSIQSANYHSNGQQVHEKLLAVCEYSRDESMNESCNKKDKDDNDDDDDDDVGSYGRATSSGCRSELSSNSCDEEKKSDELECEPKEGKDQDDELKSNQVTMTTDTETPIDIKQAQEERHKTGNKNNNDDDDDDDDDVENRPLVGVEISSRRQSTSGNVELQMLPSQRQHQLAGALEPDRASLFGVEQLAGDTTETTLEATTTTTTTSVWHDDVDVGENNPLASLKSSANLLSPQIKNDYIYNHDDCQDLRTTKALARSDGEQNPIKCLKKVREEEEEEQEEEDRNNNNNQPPPNALTSLFERIDRVKEEITQLIKSHTQDHNKPTMMSPELRSNGEASICSSSSSSCSPRGHSDDDDMVMYESLALGKLFHRPLDCSNKSMKSQNILTMLEHLTRRRDELRLIDKQLFDMMTDCLCQLNSTAMLSQATNSYQQLNQDDCLPVSMVQKAIDLSTTTTTTTTNQRVASLVSESSIKFNSKKRRLLDAVEADERLVDLKVAASFNQTTHSNPSNEPQSKRFKPIATTQQQQQLHSQVFCSPMMQINYAQQQQQQQQSLLDTFNLNSQAINYVQQQQQEQSSSSPLQLVSFAGSKSTLDSKIIINQDTGYNSSGLSSLMSLQEQQRQLNQYNQPTAYVLASQHLNKQQLQVASNGIINTSATTTTTAAASKQQTSCLSTKDTLELVRATMSNSNNHNSTTSIDQQQMERASLIAPIVQKMSFRCHVCGSGFEDKHRLQQHLSIHLNLHSSWFEEKTIKKTMAQYELRRGDYLCQVCQYRFETTAEFDKHMQLHGEKPHQCELCSQESNKFVSFRYFRQLLTHLRSHCFLYSCRFVPECKQTANRKDYLKLHILKHHLNNKLPEQYTICCH